MDKILHRLKLGLFLIFILISGSCKREQLAEVLSDQQFPAVSMGMDSKLEIGNGSKFTLTSGQLIVPVNINFSAPTSRAFTVNLAANMDTVANLISAGTLNSKAIAFEAGSFSIPPFVKIPMGVSSFTFDMSVSRSFIEKNYGKEIAVALKIFDPGKGNTVLQNKNATVVLVKTEETMAMDAVHFISFASKDFKFAIPEESSYEVNSENIIVSVPVVLGGDAGPAFNVEVSRFPDTIAQLVTQGKLSNVEVVGSEAYSFTPNVRFEQNKNTATLNFEINLNKLLAIKNKTAAIAFKLSNPGKYQLKEDKKTIVVLFDQDFFRPYYGTPFVIKGEINAVSEPIYAAYYDFGGLGVAYNDDQTRNGILTFRPNELVDIEDNTPFTAVGYIVAGEWLTFSVLVEESGTYEMNILAGSPNTSGRYAVLFGNTNLAGTLATTNTTAYGIYRDHKTTVKLTKGKHIMRINFTAAGLNYKGVIFTRKS